MINPCASSSRRKLFAVCSSSLLLLVVFGYDNNRSLFSTAMNVAATTSSSIPIQVTECAIVGVGVLGTRICKQLLRDPDFKDWKCKYCTILNIAILSNVFSQSVCVCGLYVCVLVPKQ